jgi:hypothetical protein
LFTFLFCHEYPLMLAEAPYPHAAHLFLWMLYE